MSFARLASHDNARSHFEQEMGAVQQLLPADHPARSSLERFIADMYFRTYGARIQHYAHQLVGLRRPQQAWLAGVGYTLATDDRLFVEQYLDRPIELEMTARLGLAVRREQVVEVGNLAASGPGAARRLIVCTTNLLHQLDLIWVVFTSTKSLLNSFGRLNIEPIVLARADPMRLADHGKGWGSYYKCDPQVMTANIPRGHAHLLRCIGAAQC